MLASFMAETRARIAVIKRALAVMRFRWWHLVVPLVLGVAMASADGLSVALLVPLGEGIASNDFTDAWRSPGVSYLYAFFDEPSLTNRQSFLVFVGLVLAAQLIRFVLQYLVALTYAYRNRRYASHLRAETARRYLSFGKQYFDGVSQGHVERVMTFSTVTIDLLDMLERAIRNILNIAARLVVMALISWRLTLFALIVLPVLNAAGKMLFVRIRRTAKRYTEAGLSLDKEMFSLLSCIPLIKLHSAEETTAERMRDSINKTTDLHFAELRLRELVEPLQQVILLLALFVMSVVAVGFADSDHTAELATFCAFLLIARQTMPMFGTLNNLRGRLAALRPRIEYLAGVFSDHDKFFVVSGSREFSGLQRGIELRDLHFSYNKDCVALTNLSYEFPAGRTTAIVGATGSGKSTLINLIARLYECPPGSIAFDGIDVHEFSLDSIHRRMAVVSQDPWFFLGTLRDNLTFGLDRPVTDAELEEVIEHSCLTSFVAGRPGGLDCIIGDRGQDLSGGERQRCAIARALLRRADIVLLDEATAALDSLTEHAVQQALTRIFATKTVIVVAHRLSTIQQADSIIVLDDAQIVEEGSWDSLLESGEKFAALWRAQQLDEASKSA